ncbi:hypothetical protein P7L75_11185 [Tistrella mobilis]|uniref:hypothetical protein n=1 Tax=Tistrella mobilis TaxID=171437 RepID=UPI003556FF72
MNHDQSNQNIPAPALVDGVNLPFVRQVRVSDPDSDWETLCCWWEVRRTGDADTDEVLGHGLAEAALRHAREKGPRFLSFVVEDMVRAGRWGALEEAFLDHVMGRLSAQ